MGAATAATLPPLSMRDVHPGHLQAHFPRLSAAAIRQLQECRRLEDRLGERLAGVAAAEPEPLVGPARLALASPEQIGRAATAMGAIWHAASVRACINGAAVARLVAEVGAEARSAALRHASLGVAGPEPTEPHELAAAVARSAEACLAFWLAALPDGVRRRVLLKLPPGAAGAEDLDGRAAPIVAAVVDDLMREEADHDGP